MRDGRLRIPLFSLLALCICSHAQASGEQRASETFDLSIPRQPLDGALQELARQCDVQVIFLSRVTEGLSAPTIRGDYTLDAAMGRLLEGSGLTSRVINPQTIEVRPLQARPTDRSEPRDPPAANPGPESAKEAASPQQQVVIVGLAEQLVATRIATPLREIPQTIAIVTGEHMRQQNEVTLADVLAHAPGITTIRSTALDQDFYARAYQITSFHIDGGAAVNPKSDPNELSNQLFLGTPDMIEFDHVEILRGADALFNGNANPGGTISLVRKRPQRNFALELNASGGSWSNRRLEMNITGPIALDGNFRGLAAAVYGRDGYFHDIDPHERKKVFAALEYDLTPDAALTLGGSYQWDRASGVGSGLPLYADGRNSRLPRDTSLEFDWTRYRSELSGLYLQYRHELASSWALKLNASRWRTEAQFAIPRIGGLIDPLTNQVNESPSATFSASPNTHTQETADVTMTGTLDWFGWREELAFGADFTRLEVRADGDGYFIFGEPVGDLRAFDPRDYPDPRLAGPPQYGIARASTADRWGMFASLRIFFGDAWSIVGGARLSGDSTDTQFTLRNGLFPPLVLPAKFGTEHVVTPYAGLMYAFGRHYSLYASYADIYLAQNGLPERMPGTVLGPVRGVNIEAGIKGEWRGGALNGSLAVYRTEQSNLPALVTEAIGGVRTCCYVGISNRSRGVDAQLSGEPMPGWNIGAGYSYNVSEFPPSHPIFAAVPKHLLKAWTHTRLPGALHRWQIGGSLHAQSETKSRIEDVAAVQPSYAVLDLRAGFDVDRHWRVALNVNNVLDKVYYETIDVPSLHAWYGEPRNWILRIDGRY